MFDKNPPVRLIFGFAPKLLAVLAEAAGIFADKFCMPPEGDPNWLAPCVFAPKKEDPPAKGLWPTGFWLPKAWFDKLPELISLTFKVLLLVWLSWTWLILKGGNVIGFLFEVEDSLLESVVEFVFEVPESVFVFATKVGGLSPAELDGSSTIKAPVALDAISESVFWFSIDWLELSANNTPKTKIKVPTLTPITKLEFSARNNLKSSTKPISELLGSASFISETLLEVIGFVEFEDWSFESKFELSIKLVGTVENY